MTEPCNCDQSQDLARRLAIAEAERDYLLSFADRTDIAEMRKHLAEKWENEKCR